MRIFWLLLKKNFLVRRKHWIQSTLVQIVIPIVLFLIGQTIRLISDGTAERIDHNTYHEIVTKKHLIYNRFWSSNIHYSPESDSARDLMQYAVDCLDPSKSPGEHSRINITSAVNENQMVEDLTAEQLNDSYNALGVAFENIVDNTIPKNVKYKIRMPNPIAKNLFDPEQNSNSSMWILYNNGIVQLQFCIDEAIIHMASSKNGLSFKMPEIAIQQMPYPPYTKADMGTTISGQMFPETIGFIFVIILCVEISYPANEKFIGINVLMAVNGISTFKNLLSWFISCIIYSVTYLAPIVLIMKHFMPPDIIPFLTYGNPFVVWVILFINLCHIITFGYHLSSYFWKPAHGVFATFMFLIIMNNIAQFASGETFKHALLYIGIIAPQIILRRMFEDITVYENKLSGVQWSNIFTVGSPEAPSEASIGVMLIWSIIGIVFNFLMTLYIYNVRPGKYGVARQPFFCFGSEKMNHENDNIDFEATKERRPEYEEVPRDSLEAGIQIRNLTKMYITSFPKKSTVHALQGVSIDFYKGQITALLGHNGAGKTTMMSILSGLTSMSGGAVFIDDKDIRKEKDVIRNNIGLCPQENMVFPDLTVYEQLRFFGTLKAKWTSKQELDNEIDALLQKVNLIDKKNTIPKQLSGGQKRRLCLAMAVIGDAKVLILDEPTSGMDPESKREVRNIILKLRGEKTIIISTHDMEEADILGDRIAIMHTGKLRSYGTSMFLKKLYGDGQVEVTLSVEPSCDPSKVLHEIEIQAQILNKDEGKLVLAIPMSESLPRSLDKLESLKADLGITGMSVSIITLEQVFLRVTKDKNDDLDHDTYINFSQRITGFPYLLQTFKAYFVKKAIFAKKNFFTLLRSLLLPCIASVIMAVSYGSVDNADVATKFNLDIYGSTEAIVKSDIPWYAEHYAKTMENNDGSATIIKPGSETSVTTALIQAGIDDIAEYRNKYIVSAEFNGTAENVTANTFFSGSAMLSAPISVNILHNAILRYVTNDDAYSIETSAQQLPLTQSVTKRESVDGPMITLAIMVFLAPAVALYVTQPLEETRTGVKRLQDMTGASRFVYWSSMFIFDFLQFIVSALLLLGSFLIVDSSLGLQFYRGTEIGIFMLIMMLFGMSMLPFVYLATFLKKSLNTTIRILSLVSIILGFVEIILQIVQISWDNKIFHGIRDVQLFLFQFFPFVSFLYGHTSFFTVVSKNARCRRMTNQMIAVACLRYNDDCCERECLDGECQNPFPYFEKNPQEGLPSLADSMYYFAGSFVLFFLMIYVVEKGFIGKLMKMMKRKNVTPTSTAGMDQLVLKERALIAEEISKKINGGVTRSENIFLVHELKKSYGKVNAVKGTSFRVRETECFGLLGVNGAGKSTTFRMLTGEETPDSGQMWLKNYSIDTDRSSYLQEIGYCPQQDAIIETLNAWDHLYLFARLRGIPPDEVEDVVTKWVAKINLTRCAAQPSSTYSGGNKRRLNIAMSLIGNPSLVLMDEPTAGVDPAARRSLWNTLKTCQNSGQSIIFTSHSMEECEVLCNRLVIMVDGQLVCIGASQELKQRFGAGYNVHVKLLPTRNYADIQQIKSRIESSFRCTLMDENSGFIGYHITDPAATWTSMYTLMNELKNNYQCIEDFAVLSSSLEQLFIQFARAPPGRHGNQIIDTEVRSQEAGAKELPSV